MGRRLTWNYIGDSRGGRGEVDIEKADKELKSNLEKYITGGMVELKEGTIRRIIFGEPEPCISYRKRYYLKKGRKITWDEIYRIVNSTDLGAVPFDFI